MRFVNRMRQKVAKYRIDIRMKKWLWSQLLAFRKDVVNAVFLKYSKEDRLYASHVRILNIQSAVRYDDTKHRQL